LSDRRKGDGPGWATAAVGVGYETSVARGGSRFRLWSSGDSQLGFLPGNNNRSIAVVMR
jgi:hypothetical protein